MHVYELFEALILYFQNIYSFFKVLKVWVMFGFWWFSLVIWRLVHVYMCFQAKEHIFLHEFELNLLVPHHEAHGYMRVEICLVCLIKFYGASMFLWWCTCCIEDVFSYSCNLEHVTCDFHLKMLLSYFGQNIFSFFLIYLMILKCWFDALDVVFLWEEALLLGLKFGS